MVNNNIPRNMKKVTNLDSINIGIHTTYRGVDIADFDEILDDNKRRYGIMILKTDGKLYYHYNTDFCIIYKDQTSIIPNEG